MTRKAWKALTEEEQHMKVASLHRPHEKWERHYGDPVGIRWKRNGVLTTSQPLDYLNDLNAMHEAEKSRRPSVDDYPINLRTILRDIIQEDMLDRWEHVTYAMINATASQRAEAFVLTMEVE